MSQENNSKKTILDQLKYAIENKEQIKEQVVQNLIFASKIAEAQAKVLVKQAKESKVFNEQIAPLAGSELADKAIDVLNNKFKLQGTSIMKNIEKFRKELVDSQVAKAKEAKEAPATTEETASKNTETSETTN